MTTEATKTVEELRQEAVQHINAAEESFERCDTDGFLTQWAHGIEAERLQKQADINANGGKHSFPALLTLEGKRVRAKLMNFPNKFAPWTTNTVWMFVDKSDKPTGKFITAFPAREATMAKKGYSEGTEEAPAKAVIQGTGHGLSGHAWAAIVRTDKGYPDDALVEEV